MDGGSNIPEKGLEFYGDGGEGERGSEEEKPTVRLNRRQRGGSSDGGSLAGNPDLLTIPGVGPRNLRKLVENGISGVAELKQLYKDKVFFTQLLSPSVFAEGLYYFSGLNIVCVCVCARIYLFI